MPVINGAGVKTGGTPYGQGTLHIPKGTKK